jgi:hypothetical protein
MAGLIPAVHVFVSRGAKDVDARDFCANARKRRCALLRGHDEPVGAYRARDAISYPALSLTPARKNFCGSTASPSIRVS